MEVTFDVSHLESGLLNKPPVAQNNLSIFVIKDVTILLNGTGVDSPGGVKAVGLFPLAYSLIIEP
jgi:hypothetical protein